MNFAVPPQPPELHLVQSATSFGDLSRTTAKGAMHNKKRKISISSDLFLFNSFLPVVVVDFLQLCYMSQEYTVDLFELIFSVCSRQKLTNLKVKFFSDRASRHKIRVINVPCISNKCVMR